MSEEDKKIPNRPIERDFAPEIKRSFELSARIDELGERALDDETAFELANMDWQKEYALNSEKYDRKFAEQEYNLPITGANERMRVSLKILRTRLELTKVALAEKSAIPLHIIEMWEKGNYYYSERLLTKLAPALEVEADVLIKLATGELKSLEEIEG
jgi:DNA-binding transcriptional regulator YiaG